MQMLSRGQLHHVFQSDTYKDPNKKIVIFACVCAVCFSFFFLYIKLTVFPDSD
uniref:Uncharacterized protein n=1 Tax=Arundo donax TaxID=35708 RepID=A0A0A9DV39_ARUDO